MMNVEIPYDIAIRIVEFLNAAAGEGMYFELTEGEMYRWDPADILGDLVEGGDNIPEWFPPKMKDEWA